MHEDIHENTFLLAYLETLMDLVPSTMLKSILINSCQTLSLEKNHIITIFIKL